MVKSRPDPEEHTVHVASLADDMHTSAVDNHEWHTLGIGRAFARARRIERLRRHRPVWSLGRRRR